MKSVRMRYVRRIKDRSGRYRYYLRRPGASQHIRLPDILDDGFFQAYAKAMGEKVERPFVNSPKTLAWLIEKWQSTSRYLELAEETRKTYGRILLRMQEQDYAQYLVSDFGPVHIRRFLDRLGDRPAAANSWLKQFRILFDYAVEYGWCERNPAREVKRRKEKGEGQETWSEAHIAQFEQAWPSGSQPRLALALLLYTGQRTGDVVRMSSTNRRDDLIALQQHKTGKRLLIPVHPCLAAELENASTGAAFLITAQDKPFSPKGFYERFKEWRRKAGLPEGLSPHGLRKAAARRLAEAGCSTHQIAAITGHATLSEVARYTIAADQERLAREGLARIKK
ncbi:tyrosine-type recombinase/integrase [Saccharibacter floricola]|uniref:Phage related integrase n=1 Tax=Saccharibacter floricola DSM 15669 TaxID=1123227 RepID=A0ABQ0NWN0_9PROT|nr:site-specific integrase [Saccharibacter floricola]GBQ04956.1 phage related integrase [Saccharibacter floricola DSM 15669]